MNPELGRTRLPCIFGVEPDWGFIGAKASVLERYRFRNSRRMYFPTPDFGNESRARANPFALHFWCRTRLGVHRRQGKRSRTLQIPQLAAEVFPHAGLRQ